MLDYNPIARCAIGERYRAEVPDTLDLAERMRCVEEIGKLKQQHGISVLQINRWENLLKDHTAKAQQLGLDSEFIKAVFELIHAQAVKRQL